MFCWQGAFGGISCFHYRSAPTATKGIWAPPALVALRSQKGAEAPLWGATNCLWFSKPPFGRGLTPEQFSGGLGSARDQTTSSDTEPFGGILAGNANQEMETLV